MHHTEPTPATAHTPMDHGTGAGAKAITPVLYARAVAGPLATVSLVISRDKIHVMGGLIMGSTRQVMRTWERADNNTWKTRDPEFIAHEHRIGLELAEFLDAIDLPGRIANMLPRPPAANSTAAADAAREVGNG